MRTRMKATLSKDGTMTLSELPAVSKVRTTCRGCGLGHLDPILDLGNQYLVNFLPEIDLFAPKSPLELVRCSGCGLLQLKHTVDPNRLFREFWYRSSVNQTMRDALVDVVRTGLQYQTSGTWLDIGANDGYLLSQVPSDFKRIACEPALNFSETLEGIADHVIPDFFSADHDILHTRREGVCDVITSAAMFYDLDDPDTFVGDIVRCLSPEGVWINQLNDSPTMLKSNAFDAICHEHLCYWDLHSLKTLYNRHGLAILSVSYNDVNGGSVRVVSQKRQDATREVPLLGHPQVTEQDALDFAARVKKWRRTMHQVLDGIGGPIWCYGASTKGCCLLQYLDRPESFKAIADRNPSKYGLYMTGSWLPVMPEDDMRAERPKYALVLPWAFAAEFKHREREMLDRGTSFIFPLPGIEFHA